MQGSRQVLIANLIILFISVISIFFMFFTQAERNYDIIYVNEICRYLYCYLNHLLHYYELVNIWILSGKSVITVYREGFIMEKCMLFDSIDEQSLQELISCLSPEIKKYSQDDVIMEYTASEPSRLAFVYSGRAALEMTDRCGDEYIMDFYEKEDIMGDLFTLPIPDLHYSIIALKDCEIVHFNYHNLLTPCESLCSAHIQLQNNLLQMIAQKSQQMAMHLSILFQPTTRDKLLSYLKFIHSLNPSEEEFYIPISLSNLAEYLHVDRASMMRTLQLMKRDGLIESKARKFKLLENSPQRFELADHPAIPSEDHGKSDDLPLKQILRKTKKEKH